MSQFAKIVLWSSYPHPYQISWLEHVYTFFFFFFSILLLILWFVYHPAHPYQTHIVGTCKALHVFPFSLILQYMCAGINLYHTRVLNTWQCVLCCLEHNEEGAASQYAVKVNVTTWSVGGRCHGSQECGSRNVNFACKFHWRWHAVFGSSHNSEIYNIGARAQ